MASLQTATEQASFITRKVPLKAFSCQKKPPEMYIFWNYSCDLSKVKLVSLKQAN